MGKVKGKVETDVLQLRGLEKTIGREVTVTLSTEDGPEEQVGQLVAVDYPHAVTLLDRDNVEREIDYVGAESAISEISARNSVRNNVLYRKAIIPSRYEPFGDGPEGMEALSVFRVDCFGVDSLDPDSIPPPGVDLDEFSGDGLGELDDIHGLMPEDPDYLE